MGGTYHIERNSAGHIPIEDQFASNVSLFDEAALISEEATAEHPHFTPPAEGGDILLKLQCGLVDSLCLDEAIWAPVNLQELPKAKSKMQLVFIHLFNVKALC